jgi:uncharacterized RDD family membrane protein YckC
LFGAGVRTGVVGTRRVAEAAGLDQAAESAVEDAVVRALESPAAERALERALQSPAVERALVQVLDSEMVDRVWAHLLASQEAQQLVERIAEAPEVRSAIASQGVGLLEDIRDQLRVVARRLDDTFERIVRRLLFRRRRTDTPRQAGAVTRLLALAIDIGILNVGFFLVSALVGLVVSAIAPSGHSDASVIAIGAGAWLIAGSAYALAFWSLSGETPGMRFLGIHIESQGNRRLGLRVAFKRLIGFALAALPAMLGFLGILTNERRCGWQDRLGRTEVVYEPI